MFIFPDKDIAFIHIPKNGGLSIKASLRSSDNAIQEHFGIVNELDSCHYTLEQINLHFEEIWRFLLKPETFSFAVVRDPYSRAISAYKCFRRVFGYPLSFEIYLRSCKASAGWNRWYIHGAPQHLFVSLNGIQIVKRVLKLEHLAAEFPDVLQLLHRSGVVVREIPRINTGEEELFIDESAARALVNEIYEEDFKAFGYEFA